MANNRRVKPSEDPKVMPETAKIEKPPIDLSQPSSRLDYLRQKLDDIMATIGSIYSERLAQELLKRLEATIQEFNQDVSALLDRLEKLEEGRKKPASSQTEATPEDVPKDLDGLSEWERRLELLEQEQPTESSRPEGKPAKKGLFHHK